MPKETGVFGRRETDEFIPSGNTERGYAAMGGEQPKIDPRYATLGAERVGQRYDAGAQGIGLNPARENIRPDPIRDAERILQADAEHRSLAADQVLMIQMVMPHLDVCLGQLQEGINRWMTHQGFWQSDNKGEKIALIHSELSEMLEAVRKGDWENEKEELADTVIRILDYAGQHGMNLAEAIHRKMLANYKRPAKHGKAF